MQFPRSGQNIQMSFLFKCTAIASCKKCGGHVTKNRTFGSILVCKYFATRRYEAENYFCRFFCKTQVFNIRKYIAYGFRRPFCWRSRSQSLEKNVTLSGQYDAEIHVNFHKQIAFVVKDDLKRLKLRWVSVASLGILAWAFTETGDKQKKNQYSFYMALSTWPEKSLREACEFHKRMGSPGQLCHEILRLLSGHIYKAKENIREFQISFFQDLQCEWEEF